LNLLIGTLIASFSLTNYSAFMTEYFYMRFCDMTFKLQYFENITLTYIYMQTATRHVQQVYRQSVVPCKRTTSSQ